MFVRYLIKSLFTLTNDSIIMYLHIRLNNLNTDGNLWKAEKTLWHSVEKQFSEWTVLGSFGTIYKKSILQWLLKCIFLEYPETKKWVFVWPVLNGHTIFKSRRADRTVAEIKYSFTLTSYPKNKYSYFITSEIIITSRCQIFRFISNYGVISN